MEAQTQLVVHAGHATKACSTRQGDAQELLTRHVKIVEHVILVITEMIQPTV